MTGDRATGGRRERAKEDKRRRIMAAAQSLFAQHGVGGVTTQQIADRADVAVGTLFLYAATKAELLIMVQNRKFAEAVDRGLTAASRAEAADAPTSRAVIALIEPVVACIREHPGNGRLYLHELVFGDPSEPHRKEGLSVSLRLEEALTGLLSRTPGRTSADSELLARVISSIIHLTTTATLHLRQSTAEVLDDIDRQVTVVLAASPLDR